LYKQIFNQDLANARPLLATQPWQNRIFALQDLAVSVAIANDADIQPLFQSTNTRIFNAFGGIDALISSRDLKRKDGTPITANFAPSFAQWMEDWIPDCESALQQFFTEQTTKLLSEIPMVENPSGADLPQVQDPNSLSQLAFLTDAPLAQTASMTFNFDVKPTAVSAISLIPRDLENGLDKRQAACTLSSSSSSSSSSASTTSGADTSSTPTITAGPTTITSTATPFTLTQDDGDVVSCASTSLLFGLVPECGGPSQVVSTVASIASAYTVSVASVSSASVASVSAASVSAASASEASVSAASASAASASWASDAAVPSAGCWILDDDGWGDSAFEVYGINGWAGDDGGALQDQEDGCGILSGWEWYTDGQEEFEGQLRDTQYAFFGLSFFKGGCVERAVRSAGGPSDLACQHGQPGDMVELNAVRSRISSAQVDSVKAVASSNMESSKLRVTSTKASTADEAAAGTQPDTDIKASASAALPALISAASSLAAAAAAATATST
jgi:hypothetical protein